MRSANVSVVSVTVSGKAKLGASKSVVPPCAHKATFHLVALRFFPLIYHSKEEKLTFMVVMSKCDSLILGRGRQGETKGKNKK